MGTAVIDFVVQEHGELGTLRLEKSSGDKSLDDAAADAIKGAAPFPSGIPNLPSKSGVMLRFYFDYNRESRPNRPLCGETPPGVYRAGNSVKAPRLLHRQDPEYSAEARKKKLQAIVSLSLTVGIDGLPMDVCVAKSAGSGLDEQAVKAVRAWRFEPGTKDGVPVAVLLSVDTAFHLY